MYDPSMRVLTVLEILQAKGRVTAAELVSRFEVSTRTVQRYIVRLQDLGIPVTSTRGRGAEYRLRPSFRMPPLLFNNEEAFAVALGLNALQHVGLTALAPALVGVETKLERTLPTDIWQRTQALSTALHLEKASWLIPVDSGLITEIASAIEARQELEMTYQNYQSVTSQRTVQPLGLLRNDGIWFLAAYCLWRQDERLFRVDRIQVAHKTRTRGALYHHFGSKQGLFEAVVRVVQGRLAQAVAAAGDDSRNPWASFVNGCHAWLDVATEPTVRQILLLDAPAVLGWERWLTLDAEGGGRLLREGVAELAVSGVIDISNQEALTQLLNGAMNQVALWVAYVVDRDAALTTAKIALEQLLMGLKR